jgi:hypothetical protein
MLETPYTTTDGFAKNAYKNRDELVIRPKASLPDICVGCGGPAWGNVSQVELHDLGEWCFLLPSFLEVIGFALRKRYIFNFPFCSNCSPDRFRLKKVRLDDYLAVFSGAPKSLLEAPPSIPEDVEAERKRNWFRRRFRYFVG